MTLISKKKKAKQSKPVTDCALKVAADKTTNPAARLAVASLPKGSQHWHQPGCQRVSDWSRHLSLGTAFEQGVTVLMMTRA